MIGDIFSVAFSDCMSVLWKRPFVAIVTGKSVCVCAVGIEQLSIKR